MKKGLIVGVLSVCVASGEAYGQVGLARDSADLVAQIVRMGTEESHVAADLEYLLDVIGPRLAGSAGMQRAGEWTRRKFLEYGADRSELESWAFGVGWTRGPMRLRMLAPQQRELVAASWAWAPGTHGPVAGDVVYMDARTEAEFARRFTGKLAGAWVMVGAPYALLNPDAPNAAADSARVDSTRRAARPSTADEEKFAAARWSGLRREGIAGVIRDAGKEFGLLSMSGSPAAISAYPEIVVSNETYSQMARLARRGEPVRIEADVRNSFTTDALRQTNTVAEIRGSERPNEIVIVGAHLDSWDLGTGATDNGTGAIAVLEAARLLAATHARPKRTIRFVLFGAEEEGLFGSQAYTDAHQNELPNIQAVLVLDNGTGRITGVALQGHDDLQGMWESMLRAAPALGPLGVRRGIKTGTDHLAFERYHVPAFNYDQASRGYDHTHHSQIDDFAHVVPGDVAQAATVMALNAWQLADMPLRIGGR